MTRLKLSQAVDVRLGRQRSPQHETGDHLVPYLRSANITDGALNLTDVKVMNFTPAEQHVFALEHGDVLVTEGSGSRDAVGTSAVWRGEIDETVCFQNTLLRLRPRPGITDGRFVAWWARHAHASGRFADVATGANILHLSSDGIKRLEIDVPDIDEQRRIADFLDHQVARIDAIASLRAQQITLLRESFESFWSGATLALPGTQIPLRRILTSIVDGPFGSSLTSSHYTDDGTRVIRLGNLGIASFRDEDKAYISTGYGRELAHHSVLPGDLLMAGLGDERWPLGRCCVAPPDLGPAIVKADCYRIRLSANVSVDYAAWHLSSPPSRQALLEKSRGATRARLNTAVAREALLHLPSREEQARYVAELNTRRQSVETRVGHVHLLLEKLQEVRQSLISAAVSGEFDVSTASGRRVPVTA